MDISGLRREYQLEELLESEAMQHPLEQFTKWWQQVLQAEIVDPNAMTLATVELSLDGQWRPSARIVLLKAFDEQGFTFFTHFASRKGQALARNPHASLLFYWPELQRQVRIEGCVDQVSREESETYFMNRPLASRWGALASEQSTTIPDRSWLETRFNQIREQYPDNPPRPKGWGGYRLRPNYYEFWQGRLNRLHDRLAYQLEELKTDALPAKWAQTRLAP